MGSVTVEAELRSPLISLQLMHVNLSAQCSATLPDEDGYRLDLSLTPRPLLRLCLLHRWADYRFETAGSFFVLPPGQGARLTADAGVTSSIVCHVSTDASQHFCAREVEWTDRKLEAGLNVSSPAISHALLQLANEARQPGFASDMLIQAYGAELVVHLHRYFEGVVEAPVSGGLAPWRLKLIDERLADDPATPTLDELASLCNQSVRHLSRSFRVSCGMSLGDYVAQHRLEQAKRALRHGNSIKAIANMAGFRSPSSFCQAFRKATGMTPGQYREDIVPRVRQSS